MKTSSSVILGTALALALGLSLDMIRKDGSGQEAVQPEVVSAERTAATFYQPRLGGLSLDVRLMGHMMANPVQTALRFCRSMGYSTVAEVMIRPSAKTRTIVDGTIHAVPGETQQAFAMIHCSSHDGTRSLTS